MPAKCSASVACVSPCDVHASVHGARVHTRSCAGPERAGTAAMPTLASRPVGRLVGLTLRCSSPPHL